MSPFRCVSLIAVLLLIQTYVLAQNTRKDSLMHVLANTSSDSVRVDCKIKLAVAWEAQSVDSAMHYYQEAFAIAEQNDWAGWQAHIKTNIGFTYFYVLRSKQSIDFLKEGLEFYELAGDTAGIMDAYYNLGTFYSAYDDYSHAIQALKAAAIYGEKLQNMSRLGMIYNNLGLIFQYSGQYDKANVYQFKALKIKERTGDETLSYTHMNIGLNYFQQELFDKSLHHYQFAQEVFIKNQDSVRMALSYKNMGDVYLAMAAYDEAEEMYSEAYALYELLNDDAARAESYFALGKIKKHQGEWQEANRLISKAIELFPQNGSKRQLFYLYAGAVEVLLNSYQENGNQKDLQEAEAKVLFLEHLLDDLSSVALENNAYELLYRVYRIKGPQSKALNYAQKYIESKDSLFSEQKQKAIADMQVGYETEKKELEINLLNSENELISTRLSQSDQARKNQQLIIYLLLAGIVLIVLFVVVVYRLYKQVQVKNKELLENTRLITKQKEEKELLLNEINHRVKNNLQIVSGLLELQTYNTESEALKEKLQDAQSRIQSIASIHNILYTNEQNVEIRFADFVRMLTGHILSGLKGSKTINLEIDIPEETSFHLDTTIPLGLILNELLTNAMKYAFSGSEHGELQICLNSSENVHKLSVRDNGPGLGETNNPFELQSMGMMIVSSLGQQLGSELEYKYENGAIFTLILRDK